MQYVAEKVFTGSGTPDWLAAFFGLLAGFLYNAHPELNYINFLFTPAFLFFASIYLFSYYFNAQILVPYLYLRKRYLLYVIVVLVILTAIFFIKPFDRLIGNFNMNGGMPMPKGPPPGMDEMRGPGPPPMSFRPPGEYNGFLKPTLSALYYM